MGKETTDDFVDLSGLEALVQSQEDGIVIDLLNELGQPLGLSLTVVGPDSNRMRQAMNDVTAEFSKAAADRGTLEEVKDDSDDRLVAILAKAIVSWSPNPKIGGQVVPFSEANARNLLIKFKIIRDQVELRAVRRSSFTKRSPQNSVTSSQTNTAGAKSRSRKPVRKSGTGSAS